MKINIGTLAYLDTNLKEDPNFFNRAVKINKEAINFASDKLKNILEVDMLDPGSQK